VLTVVNIPQHSATILTAGTAEGSVGRDGDGVEDTSVTSEVALELTVVQVPDLDDLVPTARDDERVLGGRRESHAGNPVGVVLVGDGVLALGQSVPQLDGLVAGTRHNLTVVGGERNGVDILSVSTELTDGGTSVQVPQAHGGVHGTGKSELTIGRNDGVADGLIVTSEATTSVTWIVPLRSELPDHSGLIARSRDDQVGLLIGGRDGGHPVGVAHKGSTILDVGHGFGDLVFFD